MVRAPDSPRVRIQLRSKLAYARQALAAVDMTQVQLTDDALANPADQRMAIYVRP